MSVSCGFMLGTLFPQAPSLSCVLLSAQTLTLLLS
jgi:hypothetical protein